MLLERRRGETSLDLALEGEVDDEHRDHRDGHTSEEDGEVGGVTLLLLELDEALGQDIALRIAAFLWLHQDGREDVLVPLARGR